MGEGGEREGTSARNYLRMHTWRSGGIIVVVDGCIRG